MTTSVVVPGAATAASDDEAMTWEKEKGGVDLLFIPVFSALRQKMR